MNIQKKKKKTNKYRISNQLHTTDIPSSNNVEVGFGNNSKPFTTLNNVTYIF